MNIYKTLERNYIEYCNVKISVIIDKNNELWFNANNTAKALGYSDLKDAIKRHVKKKDTIQLKDINYDNKKGGHSQTLFLNEAGLYSLMIKSRMPNAVEFTDWITHDVLPSIRKYGSYKLKKEYEKKFNNIMKKINFLEKENLKIKEENAIITKDLKKEIFPEGGMVYVIDYSTEEKEIYRIGMTNNMKIRKKIYDTHTLHKHNVVLLKEFDCPIKLETCVRAMLYDYRYKDKKDFYVCSLSKIKKAFASCVKSIACVSNIKGGSKTNKVQTGGSDLIIDKELRSLKMTKDKLQKKIIKLDKIFTCPLSGFHRLS